MRCGKDAATCTLIVIVVGRSGNLPREAVRGSFLCTVVAQLGLVVKAGRSGMCYFFPLPEPDEDSSLLDMVRVRPPM